MFRYERRPINLTVVVSLPSTRVYKQHALLIHPDKCQDPKAEEAFKRLGEAYETLLERQSNYLASLGRRPSSVSRNGTRPAARTGLSRRRPRTARQVWEEFEREEQEYRQSHPKKRKAAASSAANSKATAAATEAYKKAMLDTDVSGKASAWKTFQKIEQHVCLLCRRQFRSQVALVRHERYSDLHRQNVEKK